MGRAARPCHARVRVKTGVPSAKQSFFVNRLQKRGGEEGARYRAECSCRARRLFSSSGIGSSARATAEGDQREEDLRGDLADAWSLRSAELLVARPRRRPLLLRLFYRGLREPQLPAAAAAAAASPLWVWGLLGLSQASAPAPRRDA